MQFEIQSSTLSPVLGVMNGLIGTKTSMPICDNVKFYEQDGEYLLTATSGDQSTVLTTVLPLENVTAFHPFLVNAAELASMVKAAEGSIFPLTFKTGTHNGGKLGDHSLCIDYGEGEYQLIWTDIDEYPVTNVGQSSRSIELPATSVSTMATASAFTSADELRPVMQNVFLDVRADGIMRVVATDSKTLFLGNIPDITVNEDIKVLVSPKLIGLLGKLTPKGAKLVVQTSQKFVIFSILSKSGDGADTAVCRIESRVTEGRFPSYEKVLPNNDNSVLIEAAKFQKAIDRAAVCANAATNQLRFDLVPNQPFITVKAQDVDTSKNARTTLEVKDACANVKSAIAIGLRSDYLTRCIRAVGTNDINFTFTSAQRACLLKSTDEQTTVLIMPSALVD